MSFEADERGLAIGIVSFVLVIAIGALLWILFDPALTGVFSSGKDIATTSEATTQVDRADNVWGYVLIYTMALGGVYLIARAIRESRLPGR